MRGTIAALLIAATGLGLSAQLADNTGADFSKKLPVHPLSPADEAARFILPPGYRMDLVASEPDVVSPAVMEWDGDGRLYISEFRSYMRDEDGTSQHDAINRISRWESTKGDGVYDKHTVFADHLVFPRMILAIDHDCILTNESHSDDVIKLCDTNGDGIADTRTVWYSGVGRGRGGNLEHEQSNFVWGLDNWIYSTFNAFRFRWTPNGILREPTAPNGGQFGLTEDDDGKPWFVNAGAERGPVNFQIPIQYGAFSVDDQFEPGFDTVWPAPGLGDMQGGMGRVRQPIGALNHFTATAGSDVFRGDRLPAALAGDLFITEPVGRMVRRALIVKNDGLTQLRNATPGSEFLLGTDPLFRPVNLKTGPDGVLYVTDMYRGIIQEATWVGPGSYLRRKVEQYQLDKIIDHGRVWRLRYDGTDAIEETAASGSAPEGAAMPATPALALGPRPHMLEETPAELVAHLAHPNGWWRDMAQRLLVLRQDRSVVPALQAMARRPENVLARLHAIWTLEGLGALDAATVRDLVQDPEPRVRVQALRASETLYKAGDLTLAADYRTAAADRTPDVAIQAMLTATRLHVPDTAALIRTTMASDRSRGVQLIGAFLLTPAPAPVTNPSWTPDQRDMVQRGGTIYQELCSDCHGADGRGTPVAGGAAGTTMAPPLAGSARVQGHRDYVLDALLHGLTGSVEGRTYTQVMIPMGAQSDDWIASVGSYVRSNFGNDAPLVSAADVARVRLASARRKTSWTVAEIESSLPVPLDPAPTWQVTASHNSATAGAGLTLAGWTSGQPQQSGMWYQVELPEPVMVTEVQFDSAGGGVLGRAARAGGPGAPAPTTGYPRQYEVRVSLDGRAWGNPVASGPGTPLTTATFPPVRARFVRVTETGTVTGAPPWVVQSFRISRAPGAK